MNQPTFSRALLRLPKCLIRANDDSATLADLYFCSQAEIDRYDQGEDDTDIKTKTQRQAAQKFVDWLKPHIAII